MPATMEPPLDPKWKETADEMIRLYNAYRVSWLNAEYHGAMHERVRYLSIALKTTAALAASGAFVGILGKLEQAWTPWILAFSAAAALASVAQPFLGLEQKMAQYDRARFLHQTMFGRLENLLREIRRRGYMSEEQSGAAKALLAWHSGLSTLDPHTTKSSLQKKITRRMNELFPDDETAWDRF